MKKLLLIFFVTALLPLNLSGAENYSDNLTPGVSIGINGNYGIFDITSSDMDLESEKGLYAGGGITLEKLVLDNFGFGSGIQFRYSKTDFVMSAGTDEFKVTWTIPSMNIPLFMILSFRGDFFAVNLEAGVVYSHIFNTSMKTDTSLPVDRTEDNPLKYIKANQIGVTGGIIFKIKVTEYTDFTCGTIGEYYPTNMLIETSNTQGSMKMFNYSITAGWMFRTNVFR